ncbi:GGDEF domain-containing protein [Caldimonas sp. KR1-144]|uniref:GGDEF domain-containing protein n=1 Tax=Caldimonas sp. KR1-144 TaxID=3400911 RepID=UPI003BFE3A83
MPVLYPIAFLAVQLAIFVFLPSVAAAAAYVAMVAAPLLAALALAGRARRETGPARAGWRVLALSLTIWSLGAFGNLWYELIEARQYEMYRDAMLAFNLAAVPIAFLLASDWRATGHRLVRLIDAVLALSLGQGFFLYTWAMLTAHGGTPDDAGVTAMVWLLDAQNLFLAIGTLVRWRAAEDEAERSLFRALSSYELVYLGIVFINNHFLAGNPSFGPQESSIVTLAFALLAWWALRGPSAAAELHRRSPVLVRAVRSARPILLAGALLIVSLFLIRVDYAYGAAGVLIAVIGYAMRNTLAEVRHIEHGELLQREHSELRSIAWTDALTGVANRRALEHALSGAARRELQERQSVAVLMIDIDHFKLLNDRCGHVAGDACLRAVAQALRHALARPGDVLARYGGEEFIALLHEADAAGAMVVGERLRAAVEALRIEHLGSPFGVVTVSVGVAGAILHDDAAAAALVDAADRALYDAKCDGRNRVATAPIGVAARQALS